MNLTRSQYTIRRAQPADVPTIINQRRGMFLDMGQTLYLETPGADEAFATWVLPRLESNEYIGWFVIDSDGSVVAGAGLWVRDWLPQVPNLSTRRGYVLNVFVEPAHRQRGLAHQLMTTLIDWCRVEGIHHINLHASDKGRPIYESLGFASTNEMKLTLI